MRRRALAAPGAHGVLVSFRVLVTGAAILLAGAAILLAGAAMAAERRDGAVLPGGNSKQPINIEAVKLDYFDKEQKLIYTGNVVATQGDSTMKSSVLTIFLVPKSADAAPAQSSTGRVQRMLMAGPVTMLQRDQVGTGDNGVYDKGANTVVLTGNVTLSQGPNVTKGDKLVYDLRSGQAVVTGRVKSMFLPSSNDPPPAAAEDTAPRRGGARKGAAASATGSRGL